MAIQLCHYVLFFVFGLVLTACDTLNDVEKTTTEGYANIIVSVFNTDQSRPYLAAKTVANTIVPDELTSLLIEVLDAQKSVVAEAEVIGTSGRVTLQVKAGAVYTVKGTGKAGDEVLFLGEASLSGLQAGRETQLKLSLAEQIQVSLGNNPANIAVNSASVDFVVSVNGLNNTQLRWRVNGVQGGSAEFGFISDTGRYTPPANIPANSTVTIVAEPVAAPSFAQQFTLVLSAENKINNAPVAVNSDFSIVQDTVLTGVLAASDADGNALTYSIINAPSSGTVSINDVTTGAFSYTPNNGVSGTDSFTFGVNDGFVDSNIATVSITIDTSVADTDGDGLLDVVETGTGIYVSATDTGSDPLVKDSDGDSYGDGEEVLFLRTDPNDINSVPITTGIIRASYDDGTPNKYAGSRIGGVNADGTVVVFTSNEESVSPFDSNGSGASLYYKKGNQLVILNKNEFGNQPNSFFDDFGVPSIDDVGNRIVFLSREKLLNADTNLNRTDVYMRDVLTGTIHLISTDSAGNALAKGGNQGAISGDGRFVVFSTSDDALVPPVAGVSFTNGIFVKNIQTGQVTRVDIDNSGNVSNGVSSKPAISQNGRFVAFLSTANNLTAGLVGASKHVFRHDRDADGNGIYDEAGKTETVLVNVSATGEQGNGSSSSVSISSDGNLLLYLSTDSNVLDVSALPLQGEARAPGIFLRDMNANSVILVNTDNQGNLVDFKAQMTAFALSGDGRYFVFQSLSEDLVVANMVGAYAVYVKDIQTGALTMVSAANAGSSATAYNPVISRDGRYIVFDSRYDDLIADDVNLSSDVFMAFNLSDRDGDRLSDYHEFLAGTDENKPDTDGDGVYDGAEIVSDLNPLDPTDSPADLSVAQFNLLEVNDGGFTGTGAWEYGSPSTGPLTAHSGLNVWATNLSGGYTGINDVNNVQIDVLNFPLFITNHANDPVLAFRYYMQGDTFDDYAYMNVSLNNGKQEYFIEPHSSLSFASQRVNGYPDCCDVDDNYNIWALQYPLYSTAVFELSGKKFEGQVVKFSLNMEAHTANSNNLSGFYLDDIYIGSNADLDNDGLDFFAEARQNTDPFWAHVLIDDHFSAFPIPPLNPAWNVTLTNASAWNHFINSGSLVVDEITPINNNQLASVTLSRTFAVSSDFDVTFDFYWNTASLSDTQAITLKVFSSLGSEVVKIGFENLNETDNGSLVAHITGGGNFSRTVVNNLTSLFHIRRKGNQLDIFLTDNRDNTELVLSANVSAEPVGRVDLEFSHLPTATSTFPAYRPLSFSQIKMNGVPLN